MFSLERPGNEETRLNPGLVQSKLIQVRKEPPLPPKCTIILKSENLPETIPCQVISTWSIAMMGASKLSSLLNFNNTLIVAVKAQDGDRRSESCDSRSYLCRFHWWTACPGCPTLDGHPLHPGGEHRPLHSPRCAGRLRHPDSGRPHRHLLETGQHHLREERGPRLPLRKVQHSPLHQEDLPEDHHDCPRPSNLHGHQLETTSRTGSLAPGRHRWRSLNSHHDLSQHSPGIPCHCSSPSIW